jgi:hypothetical protein
MKPTDLQFGMHGLKQRFPTFFLTYPITEKYKISKTVAVTNMCFHLFELSGVPPLECLLLVGNRWFEENEDFLSLIFEKFAFFWNPSNHLKTFFNLIIMTKLDKDKVFRS